MYDDNIFLFGGGTDEDLNHIIYQIKDNKFSIYGNLEHGRDLRQKKI